MSELETYRLLKQELPDPDEVARLFAEESDEALLAAIANPDHSKEAHRILRELADGRGLAGEKDDGWLLSESSMFVAPFGSRPTFEDALAAPRRRRRIYRTLQVLVVASLAASIAGFFAADQTYGRWVQEGIADGTFDSGLVEELRSSSLSNEKIYRQAEGARTPLEENLAAALIIVAPLLWIVVGVFSWTGPSRILLLRPFQSKGVSRSLKRFVNKNVAFHGHTFTLADKFVKESRLGFLSTFIPRGPEDIVLIPLFFVPSIRQFKRWINVTKARHYRFLKTRLKRHFTLNLFWQGTYTKILKVKSSDAWWKACIDILMYSSHLIVVDLSVVKGGTEWELEKIDVRNLERKSIFTVAEENVDYAREVIDKYWSSEEPPPLHVYRTSGKLLDPEAYERDVARIISDSHLWHYSVQPSSSASSGASGASGASKSPRSRP